MPESGNVGNLNVSVNASIENFRSNMNAVNRQLSQTGSAFKQHSFAASAAFTGLGNVVATGTVKMLSSLGSFVSDSMKQFNQFQASDIGLESIVNGMGRDLDSAKAFIQNYIKDGLVPLSDATTSYKQLLSRGYADIQIQDILMRFKDSAAFARQGSLSMGEAIRGATEGLKNENSVLVDNVGVTENVSKMWENYAKSIGVGANSLTKAQKIQAEYNGIMQATKFQIGDAAKYSTTLAGRTAALTAQMSYLKNAFGTIIEPIMMKVIPALSIMITKFTDALTIVGKFSQALFGTSTTQTKTSKVAEAAAKAQTALGDATKKAGDKAKGGLAAFDEINELQKSMTENSAPSLDAGGTSTTGSNDSSGQGGQETGAIFVDTAKSLKTALEPTIVALDKLKIAMEPFEKSIGTGLKDFYTQTLTPIGKWVLGEGLPKFIDAISFGLTNINYTNINSGLKSLFDAISPFAINVGEGLLWFYSNVLTPLGLWVANKVVPDFLTSMADVLKISNTVLEAFKPLGIWLYNEFLVPLATWTGGLVATTLDGIAASLTSISNWATKNKEIISGTGVVVASFMLAWEATKVLAFIELSGGIVGAFKLITDAVKAATIAKIANKLETIALTAMYAKDFLMSISKTSFEIVAQTIRLISLKAAQVALGISMAAASVWQGILTVGVTAYNVVCGIAVGLTTALDTALAVLTSPITLVIAAIAALVAGGYVLITHWQEVKVMAANTWDWISNKLGNLWNWVSDNTEKVWGGAKTTIVNSWATLKDKGSTTWESIKSSIETAWNWAKDNVSPIWDGVKGVALSAWEGIETGIKGYVNGIIKLINFMKDSVNIAIKALNKLSFAFPDWIPGMGGKTFSLTIPTIPDVPYLARGGIVSSPTIAKIGEAGPEAIVPLENTSFVNTIASAIGTAVMNAIQFSQPQQSGSSGEVVVQIDSTKLARIMIPAINKEQSRIGNTIIQGV